MPQESKVTIHGYDWDSAYIKEAVAHCRGCLWHEQRWVRRDALISYGGRSSSLFVGQKYDAKRYMLIRGGWTHDHCEVCWWDLFETHDVEHSIGYTDGCRWICSECYHRFLQISDKKTDA